MIFMFEIFGNCCCEELKTGLDSATVLMSIRVIGQFMLSLSSSNQLSQLIQTCVYLVDEFCLFVPLILK